MVAWVRLRSQQDIRVAPVCSLAHLRRVENQPDLLRGLPGMRSDKDWGKHRVSRRKSGGQNSSPVRAPWNGCKWWLGFHTDGNVLCLSGFATPPAALQWANVARVASITEWCGIYCFARSGPLLIASGLLPTSSIFLAGALKFLWQPVPIQTDIWVGFSERDSFFFLPSLFALVVSNHINGSA